MGTFRARRDQGLRLALVCILLSAGAPSVAHATNGLNLIGSGGISTGLAGADTAVATDFSAMNTNPAGMAQLTGKHAGLSITVIKPQLHFMNAQNSANGEDDPLVVPNMGYVHPLSGTPLTLGIGLFSIGGTASDFQNLTTPFATIDKTGAIVRQYSLTPSLAYKVNERFSLGATLGISYSDASFTLLPNTSVPPNPLVPPGFAGFEITGNCSRANGFGLPGSCPYAIGLRPKFGAMFKPHDMVTLGLVYTMKSIFAYDHGKATRQQPIGPLGSGVKVSYDVDISGFKWADDLAFGVAVRPNDRLLISSKLQWINWDAAMNSVVVNFTNGDNPAKPTDYFIQQFNWKSQIVFALGASYDVTDRFNLRGGYNYGNNPVPDSTLDPTSVTIVEHHLTLGGAYTFTPAFMLDAAFDYAPANEESFNSPLWGSSTLKAGGFDVTFSLTYWN